MKTKQITFEQAREFSRTENLDFYPFATLNDSGKKRLSMFIRVNALDPDSHNLDAWATDAEKAADDILGGQVSIIEMTGRQTLSRNPATCNFEPEHFDWHINESAP